MTIKYEIKKGIEEEILVKINDEGVESFIPMDESNSDYQAYLNKDEQQAALKDK